MTMSTFRKAVKMEDGWQLLATGPMNVMVKVCKDSPMVKFIGQTTATPSKDVNGDNYLDLSWDDIALSVSLATGESLYYSVESGHRSFIAGFLQSA
jgi:hypothetical protein